jgi:hypothetical protein
MERMQLKGQNSKGRVFLGVLEAGDDEFQKPSRKVQDLELGTCGLSLTL